MEIRARLGSAATAGSGGVRRGLSGGATPKQTRQAVCAAPSLLLHLSHRRRFEQRFSRLESESRRTRHSDGSLLSYDFTNQPCSMEPGSVRSCSVNSVFYSDSVRFYCSFYRVQQSLDLVQVTLFPSKDCVYMTVVL